MLDAPVTDAAHDFLNPFAFDPWELLLSAALPDDLDDLDLASLTAVRANLTALIEALDFEGEDAMRLKKRFNQVNQRLAHSTPIVTEAATAERPNPPDATPATAAPCPAITDRKQAANALRALDELLTYFAGGKHWTRGRFIHNYGGRERRCLIGALDHLSLQHVIDAEAARAYLHRTLGLTSGSDSSLIGFNDDSRSFKQFRRLIDAARELACEDMGQPPQWHAPTITEADRLAVMAEPQCAELAKMEAAEARKRRLQREIELERVARAAKGDTRLTYILCPEPPSHYRVSKVFVPPCNTLKNQSNRCPAHVSLNG